jgi:predicted nucleic acid-binding protein
MRKPKAVIDTCCVIALHAINAIRLLPFLYSRVLLPKAVRTELFRCRRNVDDPWGRNLAERHGLQRTGTIGILRDLFARGSLSAHQVRADLELIRRNGIRLPLNPINEFLTEIGPGTVTEAHYFT